MVATLPGIRAGLPCTMDVEDPLVGFESHKSRVEDYQEDRIIVQWPSQHGQNLPLGVGDQVSLSIPTQDSKGRQAATLYLDGDIVNRQVATATTPLAMLVVRVTAVGRQQQRGHFRLYAYMQPIDCVIWFREFGRPDSDGYWKPINATITDLGGGGVGFSCEEEVPEGTSMHVRMPFIMGEGDFVVDLRVMKSIPVTTPTRTRYKLGTRFEGISPILRERILRCVHRFQVEQRRRELA